MSDLNRRDFVAATAVAVACACACGVARAEDAPSPGPGGGGDRKHEPQKTTPFNAGPKSDFAKDGITDKWAKTEQIIIIHNDGKIYAADSFCTHKHCQVKLEANADKAKNLGPIYCPCHGSHFSIEGTPTKGPAKISLSRYGVSVDDKGHLIVDRGKQFEEKKWDDEGAFVKA